MLNVTMREHAVAALAAIQERVTILHALGQFPDLHVNLVFARPQIHVLLSPATLHLSMHLATIPQAHVVMVSAATPLRLRTLLVPVQLALFALQQAVVWPQEIHASKLVARLQLLVVKLIVMLGRVLQEMRPMALFVKLLVHVPPVLVFIPLLIVLLALMLSLQILALLLLLVAPAINNVRSRGWMGPQPVHVQMVLGRC